MDNPCGVQMDFDSVVDDEIQELIDSVRTAECASCRSSIANPDDLHILEKIEELDSQGTQVNAAEWPLIHLRINGRPYCQCWYLKGWATGAPDGGAKLHEKIAQREFKQLMGVGS